MRNTQIKSVFGGHLNIVGVLTQEYPLKACLTIE